MRSELEIWACSSRATLAVLSTDIVGSTEKNRKKGDLKWLEMRQQHQDRVTELVSAHDGQIFKDTGDGFLIVFRTAMEAMHCALELRANTGHGEIEIRASIHVGAVRIEQSDIRGITVNYTCRMAKWTKSPLVILSNAAKEGIVQELGREASEVALLEHKGIDLGEFGMQTLWTAGYLPKAPNVSEESKGKPSLPRWWLYLMEEKQKHK